MMHFNHLILFLLWVYAFPEFESFFCISYFTVAWQMDRSEKSTWVNKVQL